MKHFLRSGLASLAALPAVTLAASCISSGDQNTINTLFTNGGANYVVQLCENAVITVTDKIIFTAAGQELSTQNYPTGSARATIRVAVGSSASTVVYARDHNNARVRNIIVDGNRENAGFIANGDANIIMGGMAIGQSIEYTASMNPRSWSCLHVIGSGNANQPCSNTTVLYNDIGPCGASGTDAASGEYLFADGISFDCENGLVQSNTVSGPTDGGIVLFGAPGTTVHNNTIISSPSYFGNGAINMVDGEYDGSYAGVSVTNNIIEGKLLFGIGIAIGAFAWSDNQKYLLQGPATVSGNTFSGNIGWPIALDGWENGITITNNVATGVPSPRSKFADASHCSATIQTLFNENADFVYVPENLYGPETLQSNFVATSANATNFLCVSLPLPSSVSYAPGKLNLKINQVMGDLHEAKIQYQGDNNLVVLQNDTTAVWASGHTVGANNCNSTCSLDFGGDGNLVNYVNGVAQWNSRTGGQGAVLEVIDTAPWILIKDSKGNTLWQATVNGVYNG